MKRIIISLAVIVLAGGVALAGATTAFFTDTESSIGNTFAAGALDLLVDNESYYNLNKCVEVSLGVWQWQGSAGYPTPGSTCDTSWNLDDLDKGRLFFNFKDLKPDDEGEDTISLHVQNDAWACMDVTLTSDDDRSSTEPELETGDPVDVLEDLWDGELADEIEMFWWADDGDNVYEVGESTISDGIQSLTALATTTGIFSVPLADSNGDIWGTDQPLQANETVYLAKAWCFGALDLDPVAQDGLGKVGTPQNENTPNGPQVRGTGVTCDGEGLGNDTQTDGATLDVVFRAIQARHNAEFVCNAPKTATITVVKIVEGADTSLFAPYKIDGNNVALNTPVPVAPGDHTVTETEHPDYNATFGGDCDANGVVQDAVAGQSYTCTITNTLGSGTLNVVKIKTGPQNGGPVATSSFQFQINGGGATSFEADGTNSISVAPGTYDVTEAATAEYEVSYANSLNGNANCDDLVVPNGQSVTCTITNTYAPSCNARADVMLILDRSGSISGDEQTQLEGAALAFVTALSPSTLGTHMGQSSFASTGTLDQQLTDSAASMSTAITGLVYGGNTNLFDGLDLANDELASVRDRLPDDDAGFPDIAVVITDGNPNEPGSIANAEAVATAEADALRAAGVEVYVVGVGADVDATYLINNIADDPGHYFSAANFTQLQAILEAIANCEEPPVITGSLTIQKTVTNDNTGTATIGSFQFFADGIELVNNVPLNLVAGTYTVSETGPSGYTATFGGNCAPNGSITIVAGQNYTCTILNNDNPPQDLFSSNFGTSGSDTNDIPSWDEEGTDTDTTTLARAAQVSGEDTASSDGGQFAKIANAEWICRTVNSTNLTSQVLKYLWRGDADAEDNENIVIEYRANGSCTSASGWTTLTTHELDDTNNDVHEAWSSLQSIIIPGSLDNDASWFLRFRNGSNDAAESARVDGVTLTGVPI